MAVFIDLEDDNEPPEVQNGNVRSNWPASDLNLNPTLKSLELRGMEGKKIEAGKEELEAEEEDSRPNPNRNMITQALGCYP